MAKSTIIDASQITFGVEIETVAPAGVTPVGRYHHGVQVPYLPEGWTASRDSSIAVPQGYMDCEIVSPKLVGEEGLRQVVEVIAILKAKGHKVNASCGVHIHVGFDGDAARLSRLITSVSHFERALFAITGTTSRERGNNGYHCFCKGLRTYGNPDKAKEYAEYDRYHILNLRPLAEGVRKAVEFRCFSGSLNHHKITAWIQVCIGLVSRSAKTRRIGWLSNPKPLHRERHKVRATVRPDNYDIERLLLALGWGGWRSTAKETHGWLDSGDENLMNAAKWMRMMVDAYRADVERRGGTQSRPFEVS